MDGEEESAEALGQAVEREGRCGVGGEVVLDEGGVEILKEGLVVAGDGQLVLLGCVLGRVRRDRLVWRGRGTRTA